MPNPNLSDAIRQSFLNNLGQQGIKTAYNNIVSQDDEEEHKKKKMKYNALQKFLDNSGYRE